jgi:cation transport protein ChaC
MNKIPAQRWIFGYGSLMWHPGFSYVRALPALLHGYHRSFCVYSYHYRGTPDHPGLVLGLDRGGSCHGVAFEVDDALWEETLRYLREREQVTMVYHELCYPVRLMPDGKTVKALTYAVDRRHAQYAGGLSHADVLAHIKQGHGQSGPCRDYVMNTLTHLRSMGIHDRGLELLGSGLQSG